MSTILKFRPLCQCPPDEAKPSHYGPSTILTQIATLVSIIERQQTHSTEDLRRAIFVLDLANACSRLLINQLPSGATASQLLSQSERIEQLLMAAGSALHTSIESYSFEPSTATSGDCDGVE